MRESSEWGNRRILFLAAMVSLIVTVIWRAPEEATYLNEHAGEIVLTFVFAIGLTYLLRPVVNALQKFPIFSGKTSDGHKKGRALATTFLFICIGLAIYLLFLVGLRPISRDAVAMWQQFVPENPQDKQAYFARIQESIRVAIQPYMNMVPPTVADKVQEKLPAIVEDGISIVRGGVGHVFKSAGFIVELLLIPVLVFYFLCDGPAIRAEARLLLPEEWRPRFSRMAHHLDKVFDGYIRGQVLMCVIAWILVTCMLLGTGMKYAFTLGLIAGLTRAVPIIGPLLGALPLALVCFITTQSVPKTLLLLLGFTLMHFLESKVLLPRVVGHEVDLHPVTVIIALLIGMEFFGFLGVFLAVPLAAVLKIVLAEWHEARRVARLEKEAQLQNYELAPEAGMIVVQIAEGGSSNVVS